MTPSTTNTAALELLPTPCGWVRTKNDRYELRIGKEMPPDRSNGNAGPWVAIFDTPSVLAALTDAIDNRHMPVVTDAMVKSGIAGYEAAWERHEAKRGSGSMAFETLVRAALTEALTQQQGGEQEAGELLDIEVMRALFDSLPTSRAKDAYAAVKTYIDLCNENALRSKQPAASEGE